jgi:membrane protease YdiL (CAAX protease family)
MNSKKHAQKRAGSQKPGSSGKVWGPWATIGLGLAALSAFLLSALLVIGIFYINKPYVMDFSDYLTFMHGLISWIGGIISSIVVVGVVVIFIRLRKGMPLREYLGLRRLSIRNVLISVGVTVVLYVFSEELAIILKVPTHEEYIQMYRTSVWPFMLWIALVIFGPIGEETLFRGFVFEGFYRSKMGTVLTVLLTSVSWTLLHIGTDLYSLFVTFILGLSFGVMRLRTKSLWSPILMHSTVNLITMIMIAMSV